MYKNTFEKLLKNDRKFFVYSSCGTVIQIAQINSDPKNVFFFLQKRFFKNHEALELTALLLVCFQTYFQVFEKQRKILQFVAYSNTIFYLNNGLPFL